MASFAELRKKQDPMAAIKSKMKDSQKGSGKNDTDDDTFWSMDHLRGEDGTGTAVIRFLPATEGEDDPWVHYVEHIFQGDEHWYVNRSRMTLGSSEKDPVYEYNGKVFRDKNLSEEAKKKKLKPRKKNYVSNIYIVDDPMKPENNGKVKKFKYGPQIFNIIQQAIFPEFGEEPVKVFDPFDGANFRIRVYTKKIKNDSVPSYEKSSFDKPSELCSEDEFDAIWAQQFKLQEIVAPKMFRPYKELKLRFDLVEGLITQEEYDAGIEDLKDGFMAPNQSRPKEQAAAKQEKTVAPKEETKSFAEDIDDDIPFSTSTVSDDDSSGGDEDDWFAQLKK
ncbi:single-stranded DNA-binding protein [Rhizobium phage RHph_I1_18]|nr:single-stranded DNA-binding protein [Rhizobium phage RHph_I1_18]